MKKLLKITLSLAMAFVCVFSFTACKKQISATTVSTANVASTNGVTTNGGVTAVYGDYLYFINGVKANDGKSAKDNTRGAICRVKYNKADGKIDDTTYEVVVDDLVGYDDCSLYFFGDYMYYATPSTDKNNKATTLYSKTKFMRYDLVNKQSYALYTTQLNDEKEEISYSYYIVGEELHLVVYEKNNSSITSLKIDKDVKTNYVINNATSCVLSENYGNTASSAATVDANKFVFYTVDHEAVDKDAVQTGNKVYRTSVKENNSALICDNGESVSILSIKSGKLIFALGTNLYANTITGAENEKLSLSNDKVISFNYASDQSILFIENEDGTVSVLYYDSTSFNLNIIKWNNMELETVTINEFSKDDKFEFITTVTVTETEEAEAGADPVSHEITYLVYINTKKLYKIEISCDGEYTVFAEPIQLTKTEVVSATGLLVPEVVGTYVYVYAQNDDKNTYLYRTDLTIKVNASELEDEDAQKATFIGIKEEKDEKK